MTRPITHIVGAGLAGLSAALRLTEAGHSVRLYEANNHAGGRCRSYFDETLGKRLDNGNHLLISGNRATLDYLKLIGAEDSLIGPDNAQFPFVDVATGERWTVELSTGVVPFWLFSKKRRVPGTKIIDYLGGLRLAWAAETDTVESLLGSDVTLFRRFWEPLAVAVLNTEAEQGAAQLLWPVLKETFLRGGAYCRPLIAQEGLSESFIDPALAWLKKHDATIRFGARIRALKLDAVRVTHLAFGDEEISLGADDALVLAVPPNVAAQLLPGLTVPDEFRSIVNAHFMLSEESSDLTILGVLGGTAEWIFRRGLFASVTVSAASKIVDDDAEDLAQRLWLDVSKALHLAASPLPPWRVVKEKRATFAQTPQQLHRRPPAKTAWKNLALAGDWVDTGLPATIEGAIRSGKTAAQCLIDVTAANALQH